MNKIQPDLIFFGVRYVNVEKLEWAEQEVRKLQRELDAAYKEIRHLDHLHMMVNMDREIESNAKDISNVLFRIQCEDNKKLREENIQLRARLGSIPFTRETYIRLLDRIECLENPNLDYS